MILVSEHLVFHLGSRATAGFGFFGFFSGSGSGFAIVAFRHRQDLDLVFSVRYWILLGLSPSSPFGIGRIWIWFWFFLSDTGFYRVFIGL